MLANPFTLSIIEVGSNIEKSSSGPSHRLHSLISGHSGLGSQSRKFRTSSTNDKTSAAILTALPIIALIGPIICAIAPLIRPLSFPSMAAKMFSAAQRGTLTYLFTT